MRKLGPLNRNLAGFTLIEILMALLLIAILATIAITQFTNFSKDAKNAAVKENLAILRNGIQKHFGQMRLRCHLTGTDANLGVDAWPHINALNSNDITLGDAVASESPCTTGDIPQEADRYFAAGGIPPNPWSDKACTELQNRSVQASTFTSDEMDVGNQIGTPLAGNCGWVYSQGTGRIKANSNNNGGDREGLFESQY